MPATPSQTFCLFLNLPAGAEASASYRPPHHNGSASEKPTKKILPHRTRKKTEERRLEVPADGLSTLRFSDGADPIVSPVTADGDSSSVTFETLRHENRSYLLALVGHGCRARINAIQAARVNILHAGDVLDVGDRPLYVALWNRPYIGPPLAETIGAECAHCRCRIVDGPAMRVYVCPACHGPMHLQGDDVPEQDRLECAKAVAACRHCELPVTLRNNFVFVPGKTG